MAQPTQQYIHARCDQIAAALGQRNGNLAAGIIDLIRHDGHPELADRLLKELIESGLQRMAAGAR